MYLLILKQIKNVSVLFFKIFYFSVKAKFSKKQHCIAIVAEFGKEGGTLTYFKYLLDYYNSQQVKYLLVLSKEQELFVSGHLNIPHCIGIIEGPAVWRPFFTKKNSRSHNLELLCNQLNELLFFSKLNVQYRPAYFYFSVVNPEHYLFEFCLSAKVFYACHTLTYDLLDKVKRTIVKFCISKNKRIVVVSEFAKMKIIECWQISKHNSKYITTVYNYYDAHSLKKTRKINHQSFNVLTIGTVVDYKNPVVWCHLAKKITDGYKQYSIQFFWAGSGPLLDECKLLVSEYGNIHFVGHVHNIEEYYATADIYVQPSKTESFGIAVVGAMAHSIPCIVSDAGGLPEVVADKYSGFIIKDRQIDRYIDKIMYFLLNSEEKLKMGNQGYVLFNEKFTKAHWIVKMNHLLKN